jgi:RNA polymerase sigma factor (sigma-70 family)
MKDLEIIERIRKGDETALDFLYKKNFRMMLKLILKNSGSEDDAKDVFQDALIVFWQKVKSDDNFTLTSKISTYLYSVCLNLWRKELDRKKRHTYDQPDRSETQDQDAKERNEIINRCIQELGDTCRKILIYYYFDRLSMADIADKLGFSNSDTAKTKKYKCKKELDSKIKETYSASDFLD